MDFYIGDKVNEFNNKLLSIKPRIEITRVPQPVTNKLNGKVNEWKSFALYYSMYCLKGIMIKPKYIRHWNLFVFGLNLLLKENVSEIDCNLAHYAFIKFVGDIEKLYGKKYLKFNVHILTHIKTFVKNYGAIWAWSAYPFEGFNGIIRLLLYGTQYVPKQICKSL